MAEACEISLPSDSQALLRFSATYVLNGSFTATVDLANNQCQYFVTCDGLCRPVTIILDTSMLYPCCEEVPAGYAACFATAPTTKWVNGVMTTSTEKSEPVSELSVSVSSFFTHLGSKAVATQQFNYELLSNVLPILAEYYAGIPGSLYTFAITDTRIRGPVEGTSLMEELRLLAQAGRAHLFVQVGGDLTMAPWKDHTSGIDLTITREWIISAERAEKGPTRTSLIRFRGAELTKYDCGLKPFTDSRESTNSGGYSGRPGHFSLCQTSGIPTPVMKVSLDNLVANEQDIKNATWASDNTAVQKVEQVKDGGLVAEIAKTDGSWFDDTSSVSKVLVYGQHKDKYEHPDRRGRPDKRKVDKIANSIYSSLVSFTNQGFPPAHSSFGDFSGDRPSEDFHQDQGNPVQIETIAQTTYISDCGIAQEDHENKYVFYREQLFNLAVRRFQELRMEENTWNLEIAYLPCLRLNQVIEFELPETAECGLRTVVGIVAGITLNYDAETPRATQQVTVWDVGCLGDTTYVSGNIFDTYCAGDSNSSIIPALVTALSLDGGAGLENDVGWLYTTVGSGPSYFELQKVEMTPLGTYTVSFDYDMEAGISPLDFTYPGTTVSLSGTGSASYNFSPPLSTFNFRWEMPGGGDARYRISNIKLTKTVLA